jgi:hypothetical protein
MSCSHRLRKLIYLLLEHYENKEIKNKAKEPQYYICINVNFLSEFECLSQEKRIGIKTKLGKIDNYICLKILEMLYERDYSFFQNLYNFIIDIDEMDKDADFEKSLKDVKFWLKLFQKYNKYNKLKIGKYKTPPTPLNYYKAKKPQKFYEINEIKESFYPPISSV